MRAWLAVLAALACAFAWPMQGGGGVQNAHYVLTKALAAGTPQIEGVLGELGDFATADYALYRGRKYANKAPGFALLSLPAYLVLRTVGVRTTGDPARMLWALGLLCVVAPALVLVTLVRDRADSAAVGMGNAAAAILGTSTLVLPYATVFLPHVLAAALLFAGFTLLWRARAGQGAGVSVVVAGVLCGYGVATEYPIAIGAAILFVYALTGPSGTRRCVEFAAGALVGVLPLLVYNAWAFGNAFHNSYSGVAGASVGSQFGAPSLRIALELLLSSNGLLVLNPVVVCGVVGIVLLVRQSMRAEAAVAAAVSVSYVIFNSAYFSPFGGTWPGTRYSLAILPFLLFAIAPALRERPVTCGALSVVSALVMILATSTNVLAAADGRWLDRLGDRQVTPAAVPSLVGITGWYGIVPFAFAVAVALAVGLRSTSNVPLVAGDVLLAGAAVCAWAAVAAAAPSGAEAASYGSYVIPLIVLIVLTACLVGPRAYASAVNPRRPQKGHA